MTTRFAALQDNEEDSSESAESRSYSRSTERSISKSSNAAHYYDQDYGNDSDEEEANESNNVDNDDGERYIPPDQLMSLPNVLDYDGELALAALDTSGTVDAVGSTVFRNFLLCFDEREYLQARMSPQQPQRNQANNRAKQGIPNSRALLDLSSSSSTSSPNLQTLQQQQVCNALSVRGDAAGSLPNSSQAKGTTCTNSNAKVVSLPQFLWQPSDGLCCHAGHVHFQNDDSILFEEPLLYDDNDDDDGIVEGQEVVEDENELYDDELLLLPARAKWITSGLTFKDVSGRGTPEDPQYVPRPSSTTPGLKEISKLYRTASCPDDYRKNNRLLARESPVMPACGRSDCGQLEPPSKSPSFPAVVTPGRLNKGELECTMDSFAGQNKTNRAAKFVAPSKLTKSRSTPPILLRHLHRRSRSGQIETENNDSALSLGASSSSGSTSSKGSYPETGGSSHKRSKSMMNPMNKLLFRRGPKIPSFRKSKRQAMVGCKNSYDSELSKQLVQQSDKSKGPTARITSEQSIDSPGNDAGKSAVPRSTSSLDQDLLNAGNAADIANILASLAISLKHRDNDSKRLVAPPNSNELENERLLPDSSARSESAWITERPLGNSFGTESDSSFEDILEEADEDSDDDLDDEEDIICKKGEFSTATRATNQLLARPNYSDKYLWAAHKKRGKIEQSNYAALKSPSKFSSAANARELRRNKSSSMLASAMNELTRCSSVDTAKVSNLSCDPASDRARLLDLQALLTQQRQEEQRKANAPLIDFDTPDGDNVIRVRELGEEIEVLSKRHLGASFLPPSAAEF